MDAHLRLLRSPVMPASSAAFLWTSVVSSSLAAAAASLATAAFSCSLRSREAASSLLSCTCANTSARWRVQCLVPLGGQTM